MLLIVSQLKVLNLNAYIVGNTFKVLFNTNGAERLIPMEDGSRNVLSVKSET